MYASTCWIPKENVNFVDPTKVTDKMEIEDEEMKSTLEGEGLIPDEGSESAIKITSNTQFASNEEDEYITGTLDEDEEEDDYTIHTNDMVLAAVSSNEEISTVEFHVYDPESGDLFLHHDIPVGPCPLCVEWCDRAKGVNETESLDFVAVGTFLPVIEIWSCDSNENLPRSILGKIDHQQNPIGDTHSDAVLALNWNKTFKNVMISGSADTTIKIWDITNEKCNATFKHNKDKVQTIKFNTIEPSIFTSGSSDGLLSGIDIRNPNNIFTHKINTSIEHIEWNPFISTNLLLSCENGAIYSYDMKMNKILYEINAHNSHSVSCISLSKNMNGIMYSCSEDKTVKIWDIYDSTKPSHIMTKTMAIGDILSCSVNEVGNKVVLCCGGVDMLGIWDLSSEGKLKQYRERKVDGSVNDPVEITQSNTSEPLPPSNTSNTNSNDINIPRKSKKNKKNKKRK